MSIELLEVVTRKQCCICNNEEITYKCIQCNDGCLCNNCRISCLEADVLNRCPVCRKNEPWCNSIVEPITIQPQAYRCIVTDKFQRDILYGLNTVLKITLFMVVSFIIGGIYHLIYNNCMICFNTTIGILANIFIGAIIILISYCLFICLGICCISCFTIASPVNNR